MRTSICLFLAVITCASVTVAQSKKDKVEIGVQSTSLTLFEPDFDFSHSHPGVGGRVTYNLNRSIAAEAEINYFPQRQGDFPPDADMIQAQFGVKLGKRFEKFGLFAKVRPGFLTVDQGFSVRDSVVIINGVPDFVPKFDRTFTFTLDVGGVLEWYPSRRMVVRFEAGDTMIRQPAQLDIDFSEAPFVREVRPPKFNHNFQFTAGVGFRLGDFPADGGDVKTSNGDRKKTPRFEVGAQFTSMTVAPVTRNNPCPDCLSSDVYHTEPGFGGRFTFNFNKTYALEAEGNFFTREQPTRLPNPTGYMFQGQFGPKIGKRFEKWGVFGKFRPGFVGFTQVNKLVRTFFQLRNQIPAIAGEWRVGKVAYPSLDIGGVVEFYISRRWMARFDIGDTVIRYGEVSTESFAAREPILRRGVEYHHNLQVTSGFAFRF